MDYHVELLQLGYDLIDKDPSTQADRRRAVSTSYYALFHLLVYEATLNWSHVASRNALGRMFEHGLMKRVSERVAEPTKMPFAGKDPDIVSGLRLVAKAFVQLQQNRHIADYDNGTVWTRSEAGEEWTRAMDAIARWNEIRDSDIAQEYLVSLLIRSRE